jgi:hypothetical protein
MKRRFNKVDFVEDVYAMRVLEYGNKTIFQKYQRT